MATMSLRTHGTGATDLVLLHGIPGSSAIWGPLIPHLATPHRVITPDLVGFGASERTHDIQKLWAWAQARSLARAMDEAGVAEAALVGHDFGGPVALCFASLHPERVTRLTLISCNTFADAPVPFPLSGIFWPLLGRLWERMLFSAPSLRMMVRNGTGSRSHGLDVDNYVTDPQQARAIAVIFGHALRNLSQLYQPFPDIMRGLRVPRQVIWGTADPFFSLEQGRRTAAAAGAELEVIRGVGHFVPEEAPRELAKLILDFGHRASAPEPAHDRQ